MNGDDPTPDVPAKSPSSGAGSDQWAPLSRLRAVMMCALITRIAGIALDSHTATQCPSSSSASRGDPSDAESLPAFALSGMGFDQFAPPSRLRATRMSESVPIVFPRLSVDDHAATQMPCVLIAINGWPSVPASVPAFVLSGFASDQLTPLSIDRENRMSPSPPMVLPSELFDCQTVTQ